MTPDDITALARGIAEALPDLVARELAPLREQLESFRRAVVALQVEVNALETRGPGWSYRGKWEPGTRYAPGDVCTWGGSSHLCREPTVSEPMKGEASAWSMIAQRGKTGGRCKGGHTEDHHR